MAIDQSMFLFLGWNIINWYLLRPDIELQCNFVALEVNAPLLILTFVIGMPLLIKSIDIIIYATETERQPNATPGFQSSFGIKQKNLKLMLDAMKYPEMFSNMLYRYFGDPRLANGFGDLFYHQFLETNSKDNINKAILAYEIAIELTTTDDINYGIYTYDAGLAFYRRFEWSGNLPDINKAISMLEVAITYALEKDVNYLSQLSNLGNTYLSRFGHTGKLEDINGAISRLQQAIKLTPEGDANLPTRLSGLGNSFLARCDHTRDYQGFWNPCGLRVGYVGVRVRVRFFWPSPYPYPQRGLAGYPWVWLVLRSRWNEVFRSLNRDQPWPTRLISLFTTPTTCLWTQWTRQDVLKGK